MPPRSQPSSPVLPAAAMATIVSDPSEAAVVAKKGRRRMPLKNLSASDTNASAGGPAAPVSAPSPLLPSVNPDKENRGGLTLLLSPAKANGKAKAKKKASPTTIELEELQGMLEQLRIEKAKTEELLRQRDEMLRQKEEEIELSSKERERLEKEVKKLQKLEFKPIMSIPMEQSLMEKNEAKDGSKKKKKKKKKKSEKKKKPCAAYLLFSKDHWNEVKEENPEGTFRDISNVIGERWKNLSEEERKPYEERYQKEKEEYLRMIGKERREEAAMRLLEKEQRQKTAMELLDQYLQFKKEANKEAAKTKKVKDPMKPKHPMTSFFLYSKERRAALIAENKNVVEIAKITGEEWKSMSEEKKAPYEEIARKQKEEYFQLMETYKQKKAEEAEKLQKNEEEQMKILKQEALQLLKKKEKTEEILKKTKDKKKKQKGKKNTDPNKPKKPATSFLLFSKEMRKSLIQERPDLQNSTLNALISVKWKELDSKERQVWIDRASESMTAYKKEMEEYNKSLEVK